MSWRALTQSYKALWDLDAGGAEIEAAWSEFTGMVRDSAANPPYHIKLLLDRLERFRGDLPRDQVVILDHGCGGAMTLFYIAVLGYTNFWGLDIGSDYTARNKIAARFFGHQEERLSVYDGRTIPLPDESVHVIFSQQVIEHVDDASLETYYREEGRVLKPGGLALHYVPHRLVPYDSHTKTWLIHYLPGPAYRGLARLLRSPVPDHLHLRWPWVHKIMMRRYVGPVEDVTLSRLATMPSADTYDGSVRLRGLISSMMSVPVLKTIAGAVISNLVMLETVTIKR